MSLDGFKVHSKRVADHLTAATFSQTVTVRRRYVMRWRKEVTKALTCYVIPLEARFTDGTRQGQGRRYFIAVTLLQSIDDADTEDQELVKHDELNKVLDEIEAECAKLRQPTDRNLPPIKISEEFPREAIDYEVDDITVFFAGIVLEVIEG